MGLRELRPQVRLPSSGSDPEPTASVESLLPASLWGEGRVRGPFLFTEACESFPPSKRAHPIIEGYDPPEGWGWCYVDEIPLDPSGRTTPHNGPIPRYV